MISVHIEDRKVSVLRRTRPRRPAGYALIRLICGGICNTDLELQRGYYGFKGTPGHEFVGEVLEADNPVWVGHRVVGEINLYCGRCAWCARGLERHCPNRKVLGIVRQPGAFSELFVLPERNLHPVAERIPTERAVFTEPIAAACEINDQVQIPSHAIVAVLGDGKLGLITAQVLKAHGAQVHLYGHHRENLKIASNAGIETRLSSRRVPVAAYEWIVEATGSADGLGMAIKMTKPRGTVILKSTIHNPAALDTASVVVNETTLVGSRCGRFEPALRLLDEGKISVEAMIAARFPLAQAEKAFGLASGKGILKVLLTNG